VRSGTIDDAESARFIPMAAAMDADSMVAPVALFKEPDAVNKVEMRTDFPETWLWQMEEIE
jgi:hypothetical protein